MSDFLTKSEVIKPHNDFTCTYIHAYMHIRTHMRTHTHTYTHNIIYLVNIHMKLAVSGD